LNSVIYFANIDVLAGFTENTFHPYIDVEETAPFNQKFDNFGFES